MRVMIDVPEVPYPGSRTTAQFFRGASANLRGRYSPGGSNVRGTVADLLDRVAGTLEAANAGDVRLTSDPLPDRDPLRLAPDGRSVNEELTYLERRALPAVYHQPFWDGNASPAAWICQVCWDDGVSHAWPCTPAKRGGGAIADYAGLDQTR